MSERDVKLANGWTALVIALATPPVVVLTFVCAGLLGAQGGAGAFIAGLMVFLAAVVAIAWFIGLFGFVIVNPNEARVIQLFGSYVGTIKDVGFYYGNPFYWKTKVSLRAHTFETGILESPEKKDAAGNVLQAAHRSRQPTKVNDRDGTPIEIAAVIVWRVTNTAEAIFAVDNYEEYVHIQSEAALRDLASQYSYDDPEDQAHSLRGHIAEVAEKLKNEVQQRVGLAGVAIAEARISYLAYAQEIAAAMLQRQQAGAVIAARQKIVEGAVGMVEMALELLAKKNMVQFDDDRKAVMVSNLLVVLCGDRSPQPVLNTGTIHQ